MALLGWLTACSGLTSYEVLSFFFDGVPDPNSPGEQTVPVRPPGPLTPEERAAIQAQRFAGQVRYIQHWPFAEHQCDACHAITRRDTAQPSWMQGVPELLAPPEKLCLQCHTVAENRFVHGPVAAGECALCHEAHQSRFEHLLKEEDTSQLCRRCHSGPTFVTEDKHAQYGERRCEECHDPHASGEQFLLRPEDPENAPPVWEPVRRTR